MCNAMIVIPHLLHACQTKIGHYLFQELDLGTNFCAITRSKYKTKIVYIIFDIMLLKGDEIHRTKGENMWLMFCHTGSYVMCPK